MPGKHKSRRESGFDYSPLFRRIEEAFLPEEMDDATLKDYLNSKTIGMDSLSEQLSQTKEISAEIEESESIEELRGLKKEVNKLNVHRGTLSERIDEKIIALSITTTEDFAKEKGIILSDEIKGNIERWKDGNQYIVIRENGSFVSWKRI